MRRTHTSLCVAENQHGRPGWPHPRAARTYTHVHVEANMRHASIFSCATGVMNGPLSGHTRGLYTFIHTHIYVCVRVATNISFIILSACDWGPA
eukprot:1159886-Pelagomonas_calceolata.AAC.8